MQHLEATKTNNRAAQEKHTPSPEKKSNTGNHDPRGTLFPTRREGPPGNVKRI